MILMLRQPPASSTSSLRICLHPGCYTPSPEEKTTKQFLLRSRIKPLDIRRIEHDHFIDYEVEFVKSFSLPKKNTLQVEFVELPEEESEANESDNLVISHSESEDPGQQGGGGEGLLEDSKVTFIESFA